MGNNVIQDSNSSYYNMVKIELLPLVTEEPNLILDLGCGTGQLGRKLREMNQGLRTGWCRTLCARSGAGGKVL